MNSCQEAHHLCPEILKVDNCLEDYDDDYDEDYDDNDDDYDDEYDDDCCDDDGNYDAVWSWSDDDDNHNNDHADEIMMKWTGGSEWLNLRAQEKCPTKAQRCPTKCVAP